MIISWRGYLVLCVCCNVSMWNIMTFVWMSLTLLNIWVIDFIYEFICCGDETLASRCIWNLSISINVEGLLCIYFSKKIQCRTWRHLPNLTEMGTYITFVIYWSLLCTRMELFHSERSLHVCLDSWYLENLPPVDICRRFCMLISWVLSCVDVSILFGLLQ